MPAGDDHGIGQQMEEGERVTIASQSASADDVNPGWSARQADYPCLERWCLPINTPPCGRNWSEWTSRDP